MKRNNRHPEIFWCNLITLIKMIFSTSLVVSCLLGTTSANTYKGQILSLQKWNEKNVDGPSLHRFSGFVFHEQGSKPGQVTETNTCCFTSMCLTISKIFLSIEQTCYKQIPRLTSFLWSFGDWEIWNAKVLYLWGFSLSRWISWCADSSGEGRKDGLLVGELQDIFSDV